MADIACGLSIIYRVWVSVPENVMRYLGEFKGAGEEFSSAMQEARKGSVNAGMNRYVRNNDREDWAEFSSADAAVECRNKWRAILRMFAERAERFYKERK